MLTIKAALATLHNTYCASEIQRIQNRHWGGNVPLSETQERRWTVQICQFKQATINTFAEFNQKHR